MTVKLKQLKAMAPNPSYDGRGRYHAIPHYDVVKAVTREKPELVFTTDLFDGGRTMIAVGGRPTDNEIRPVIVLLSGHDGRQPVEALFAYEIKVGAADDVFRVFGSETTLRVRHQQSTDLKPWAEQAVAAYDRANSANSQRILSWMDSLETVLLVSEKAEKVARKWAGTVPSRPTKSMFPLPIRNGVERLMHAYNSDVHRLGKTEAGLVVAAHDLINRMYDGPHALLRQFGLFLRLGDMAPPDAFFPAE